MKAGLVQIGPNNFESLGSWDKGCYFCRNENKNVCLQIRMLSDRNQINFREDFCLQLLYHLFCPSHHIPIKDGQKDQPPQKQNTSNL